MLRRRKSDAPFLRQNLSAALQGGAPCEVDIAFTADGHAVCLHDATLDRETTGHGRVAEHSRLEIERLRQRTPYGATLDSPPLFVDEIVASVAAVGDVAAALVQLDVKSRAESLTPTALATFRRMLGAHTDAFIASAYDYAVVQRLVDAAPGLHSGFDPLAFYPRTLGLDADGYRAVAARTRAVAPDAAIYYLEARLILAAMECGVDVVADVSRNGATVDAWTVDADHAHVRDVLARLIDLGCRQITTNDPDALAHVVASI